MSDEIKQVKVDNWGIYFLQRLKHFFNRTDYCDLTLQFQDNAQLKVHRLVLSACTEYFELLERTCEMYEDCLVMPDDLQADVVVPIVNFMYTGHLEFRMDLLERLYQTSQILSMPVLSKLLESHRTIGKTPQPTHSYSGVKRFSERKTSEQNKIVKPPASSKRSYSKAFEHDNVVYREKKVYHPLKVSDPISSPSTYRSLSPSPLESSISGKRVILGDPRPTRYELPEELDTDNVFDNSFSNISYACKPLMVHPENVKSYSAKRSGIFSEESSSKRLMPGTSTVDIVECKRLPKDDNIFDDGVPDHGLNDDLDIFQASYNTEPAKDSSQLFDQILDDGPKVTIETKDSKAASNLDHAKIISEVLKKYPHLVKSNKNIKLKILNTPGKGKKTQKASPTYIEEKHKIKTEQPDYTYETDVIDSQQAAKLIALGAENVKGPWICLICGTPGKAIHFTSYYKFRRHLVDVHNEKPVSNICEYCGLRSLKRNYLLHHLYSQHGIEPPPQYNFPKCNRCNYIALTEGLLVKHKMTHRDAKNFRCNVCSAPFNTTKQLLQHIQVTGHKYSAERKSNLQCIYCLKPFLRDGNLYAHLKTYHKKEAKSDGIIDDSDDEKPTEIPRGKITNSRETKYIKFEPSTSFDNNYEEVDVQYQIQQRSDAEIKITPRKQHNVVTNQHVITNPKQKILNPGFGTPKPVQKPKPVRKPQPEQHSSFLEDISVPSPPISNNHPDGELVLIDENEYIMRNNQLIPRKSGKSSTGEYILPEMLEPASLQVVQPTTSTEYTSTHHNAHILEDAQPSVVVKKNSNMNQPIQIVVSNDEEYKALMSSNHPLIFDNGDSNKTLTVLTAPHNATIQTAGMDLENTQSNDMMIIQEDFPLNVTEAVTTDNSNIVVVYSHTFDDKNKQFRILTTGGVGSQFVPSSAIITQNYETITTSAPVMSAHALEPQVTTWQDNIQSEDITQVPVETLQNVVEDVVIRPMENDTHDLNELPEVHLTSEPLATKPEENETNDELIQTSVLNSENISQPAEQEMEHEPQIISETSLEGEELSECIVEQETTTVNEPLPNSQENNSSTDILTTNNVIQETEAQDAMETVTEEAIESVAQDAIVTVAQEAIVTVAQQAIVTVAQEAIVTVTQEPVETLAHEGPMETDAHEVAKAEDIAEDLRAEITEINSPEKQTIDTIPVSENTEIEENIGLNNTLESLEEEQQPLPESQAYDDIVEINQVVKENSLPFTKEAEEKIQNLTSEWSEDEYDIAENAATAVDNAEVVVKIPECEPDLEETIENIQLEVQNHVLSTRAAKLAVLSAPLPEIDTEESESSMPEDTATLSPQEPEILPLTEMPVAAEENDPQAQVKISSLLNDWEDNDSQEESNTQEDAQPDKTVSEEIKDEVTNVAKEKIPAENIKSLVSDWDDDDEENKEQTT